MTATARTTIFGVFVLAGRPLTASQLIALAAPAGLTATNVKAHLTRMADEGVLVRSGTVRRTTYRPSETQARLVDAIDERFAGSDEPWNGRWAIVTVVPPQDRYARERAAAALWFDGFRPAPGGGHVRPDWPGSRAQIAAQRHAGADGFAFVGAPLGVDLSRLAALYDLDGLDAEALALARSVDRRPRARDPGRSFAAELEVGGEVARFIGHDPLLPDELWAPRRGMKRLREAWRRFAEESRAASSAFLRVVVGDADDQEGIEDMPNKDGATPLFEGKSPTVRAIYEALLAALAKGGPVKAEPKKTSIHLVDGTSFAGVHPRKTWLDLTIRSARPIESPRVRKPEQVSKNRWHQDVRLAAVADVDRELLAWLAEARRLASGRSA